MQIDNLQLGTENQDANILGFADGQNYATFYKGDYDGKSVGVSASKKNIEDAIYNKYRIDFFDHIKIRDLVKDEVTGEFFEIPSPGWESYFTLMAKEEFVGSIIQNAHGLWESIGHGSHNAHPGIEYLKSLFEVSEHQVYRYGERTLKVIISATQFSQSNSQFYGGLVKSMRAVGFADGIAGGVYSGSKVLDAYNKNGNFSEVKGVDMWDTGMSVLGAAACLATGPVAVTAGIVVGGYFLGRFIYDLCTEH